MFDKVTWMKFHIWHLETFKYELTGYYDIYNGLELIKQVINVCITSQLDNHDPEWRTIHETRC